MTDLAEESFFTFEQPVERIAVGVLVEKNTPDVVVRSVGQLSVCMLTPEISELDAAAGLSFPARVLEQGEDHEHAAATAIQGSTGLRLSRDFVQIDGIMPVTLYRGGSETDNNTQAIHIVPFVRVSGAQVLPLSGAHVVSRAVQTHGSNGSERAADHDFVNIVLSDPSTTHAINAVYSRYRRGTVPDGLSSNPATHGASVVFRDNPDSRLNPFLRLGLQEDGEWMIGKGHFDLSRDRHTLDTARRETREETGVHKGLHLVSPFSRRAVWVSANGEEKHTDTWLLKYPYDDDPEPTDSESGKAVWVPFFERFDYLNQELSSVKALGPIIAAGRAAFVFSQFEHQPVGPFADRLARRLPDAA